MSPCFEIRIAGQLDEIAVGSLLQLNVTRQAGDTLISGELDQAALHGVLERIRAFDLELVEARRVPGPVSLGQNRPRRHRCYPFAEGALMTRHKYEIRVIGSLGPTSRRAFSDVAIEVEPTTTVLFGDLDQTDLHALLDRVRALGLELFDIKRVPGVPPA